MAYLIRLLILALVAWLAWRLLRDWRRRLGQGPETKPSQTKTQEKTMLACAQCGTFVPADQAIRYQGRHYCCQEHLPNTRGE